MPTDDGADSPNGISMVLVADTGFSRWELVSARHIRELPRGRPIAPPLYTRFWYRVLNQERDRCLFEYPVAIDVERRVEWADEAQDQWKTARARLDSRLVHLRIPIDSKPVVVELYQRTAPNKTPELLAAFVVGEGQGK